MDNAMPNLNGIEAALQLRDRRPMTRVIMLSMHSDPVLVWRALDAGARGYVLKKSVAKDLMEAIRKDKPYNEVRRGAEASLITSMGRMAAHTGQAITRDQMLYCEHEFAPNVGELTMEGPAPLSWALWPRALFPLN